MEKGNYHVQAYLSSIQHTTLAIACNMEVIIFGWVDTGFQFEDLKSSLAQVI